MIAASSSAWSRRLRARSWNSSARSRPAKSRHSSRLALARSTTPSICSREEILISSMFSSVAGLITRIVPSDMISFRPGCLVKRRYRETPPPSRRANCLEVNGDIFRFEVLLDALGAAFAPEAGVLDAPERSRRVGDYPLVEADHAGLQALADAQGSLQVARVDVGHEAELGVVGGGDGGFFGVEGGDGGHGAEDLLLQQRRVLGNAVEHGGTVEVAGALHLLAPDERPGSFAQRVVDQLGDLGALVVVDQGTDLDAFFGAAPDLHGVHSLRELLGELAGHAVRDVEAVGGCAGFADVAHLGHECAIDGW